MPAKKTKAEKATNDELIDAVNDFLKENGHIKRNERVFRLGFGPTGGRCLEWKTEKKVVNGKVIINRVCVRRAGE